MRTPHHLRKLSLSYLDQLVPSFYVPLLFFFKADELRGLTTSDHVRISQKLKQSLSNALTSFYPLAGSIKDHTIVDSNDVGVEFIEARVNTQLMEAIREVDMENLKQYLPVDPTTGEERTFCSCKSLSSIAEESLSECACCIKSCGLCEESHQGGSRLSFHLETVQEDGARKDFCCRACSEPEDKNRATSPSGKCFWNCFVLKFAFSNSAKYEGTVEEFHDLVSKLRSAIRTVDDEYIQKSQGTGESSYLNDLFVTSPLVLKGDLELCGFSSWCGFPVYEVERDLVFAHDSGSARIHSFGG
ncbi:Stemmadenine O-acetyltransferase [Sesamum angolense]|uniref:Stemmadenine O-acetyltransferase n=1 Tax=Sesamum angolense TaxID=2727404 RepID=A0AAE1X6W3_9LAMI|nr:Stemmadenine O-acetyltransferase [Sesamum angolense]